MDNKNRLFSIYLHKNKINGKVYVGQTKQKPTTRWGVSGDRYNGCSFFHSAIKKYGWDNFEHIILHTGLTAEEANKKEKELIKFFNSNNESFGYNLTSGGVDCVKNKTARSNISGNKNPFFGKKHTEEARKKISIAHKGKPTWSKGKHFSEEARKKMSLRAKNRVVSEETKKKLSLIRRGSGGPFFGKHHTEATKEKIRKVHLGKKMSGESIKKIKESFRKRVLDGTLAVCKKGKENPSYGKHFFNNGVITVFCKECPVGFVPGIIYKNDTPTKGTKWYNNGKVNVRAVLCPEGFNIGRLKKKGV